MGFYFFFFFFFFFFDQMTATSQNYQIKTHDKGMTCENIWRVNAFEIM